jgi:hypothetical protein
MKKNQNTNIPRVWADGSTISNADRDSIVSLRLAGCRCALPLLGERPGVGPRCRTCNTQAIETRDAL